VTPHEQLADREESATVLVVEDDSRAAEVLAIALESGGYRVHVVARGRDALAAATTIEPDITVLDLGLPDVDGLDVCLGLRRWTANPIVVLSADHAEGRKVRALDLGADDYVTKPYSMAELMARLRVAQRHRSLVRMTADPMVTHLGDLVVDTGARAVLAGGAPVELTRKEFDLLAALARTPARVLTHAALVEHVWGSRAGGRGAGPLRIHVTNLRKKLGDGPERPRVETAPGVGYRLVLPDAPPNEPGPDAGPAPAARRARSRRSPRR
jgi:two-component system KDP operon response regulator KdpE